jgi:hypothetical protein
MGFCGDETRRCCPLSYDELPSVSRLHTPASAYNTTQVPHANPESIVNSTQPRKESPDLPHLIRSGRTTSRRLQLHHLHATTTQLGRQRELIPSSSVIRS